MNVVLLKNKSDKVNIKDQQNTIIKYAETHSISLDTTEIESSDQDIILEERQEFKGFLRSLSENDTILVYDLWTFTNDTGELTKILKCLFEREITVHICYSEITINNQVSPLEVLTILSAFRDKTMFVDKSITQGRPKGRMSKSKFDSHRAQIVELLTDKNSVSGISKILDVSRTSLKDYINSRGLKDLAQAKTVLLGAVAKPKQIKKVTKNKEECTLIKEEKEIDHVNM